MVGEGASAAEDFEAQLETWMVSSGVGATPRGLRYGEDTAEAHNLHLYEIRSPASACKIGVKFAGPAGKMLPIIILLANIWQH